MSIVSNKPLETLLRIWLRHTLDSFQKEHYTQEEIESRQNVRKSLNKMGVKDVEILSLTEDSCTLRYIYCGIKVMKNFKFDNEQ